MDEAALGQRGQERAFQVLADSKTSFPASEIFLKTFSASAAAGDPEAARSVEQTYDTT